MLFNLSHCDGIKNMDHNLLYERSRGDVLIRCCHCQTWHAWRQTQRLWSRATCLMVCVLVDVYIHIYGWRMSLSKPNVCVCSACRVFLVETWMTIAVHEQCDATQPMYPSPKMGQMHEQEMKSLNLVVGNGIRKHWPFVASLRPISESHDSRIFTVPPVTGLVKSQHTSLKPRRPAAGLQLRRQMQRCFFFFPLLLAWAYCNPE